MLSLSLSMSCNLRQTQWMECSCCGKPITDNIMREGPLMVLLDIQRGLNPRYRLCPTCFEYVTECNWDATYKRKWTIRVKKLIAKGASVSFGPGVHVFTEESILKALGLPVPLTPDEQDAQKACNQLMEQLVGSNWQI